MHFVLTTIGSAGDVFPMLGLALQLKERGHGVTFATNAYFAPLVKKQGIPFEPLGTAEEYLTCIQSPDLWHPYRSFNHVYNYFRPFLKRQYEILVRQASAGPTVGISSCLGFGARMAQESHGIPLLTVHLQPSVIWSDVEPPVVAGMAGPRWFKSLLYRLGEKLAVDAVVCPFLNEWRRELNLPPVKRITRWWNSPTGVLCLFPDWFGTPQRDWPQPLIQTDFSLWSENSGQPLDEEVVRFLDAGDPPIVFTPGTANVHGGAFFETAVQTCRNLQRRGILLTRHPEQLPTVLPETIRHFSYVPLDLLLSRSAAFVHHGGIGSTSQALLAGIPQVAMPLAHDQFDNAARVERLNVGKGFPAKKFTPNNVTGALQTLLNSPPVATACREMQKRLSARTGLQQAALAIEEQFC